MRCDPTEIKSDYHTARVNSSDQGRAIDLNGAPFGKLLKCVLTHCSEANVTRVCSFVSRIHALWFLEIKLGPDACPISIRVFPSFPLKNSQPDAWFVKHMSDIDNSEVTTLSKLLGTDPAPGFRLLFRYVDTLCGLHSVPIVDILIRNLHGEILQMHQASVLNRTRKSLVIQQ